MPDMCEGAHHLSGFLDPPAQSELLQHIRKIIESAPFFVPRMPRTGKVFSVRMTNCGPLGWVSDLKGYRYQPHHPDTGNPWPGIPGQVLDIWRAVSGTDELPEACLINHYAPGSKMGSHRDADEREPRAPVVSISLGDDATFHVGGPRRADPKQRIVLRSGDVFILGGPARFAYHGIDRVTSGSSTLLTEGGRINLTLRRVTPFANWPASADRAGYDGASIDASAAGA